MNEHLRRFKRVVAQVGDDCGVNFMHYGLRDLLLEVGSNPTPAELAARAAGSFCKEVDRYNEMVRQYHDMAEAAFFSDVVRKYPELDSLYERHKSRGSQTSKT